MAFAQLAFCFSMKNHLIASIANLWIYVWYARVVSFNAKDRVLSRGLSNKDMNLTSGPMEQIVRDAGKDSDSS